MVVGCILGGRVSWGGEFFSAPPQKKKKGDCRGVRIGFEVEKLVKTACEVVLEGRIRGVVCVVLLARNSDLSPK